MFGWENSQTLTFVSLLFPTTTAVLIPMFYIPKANFRDPLARAIAAVSLVVATSFTLRTVISALHYSGYEPGLLILRWSSILVYLCAGVAHTMIAVAVWRALHSKAGSS